MKYYIIKFITYLLCLILLLGIGYGLGRLYYQVTAGFTENNITYNLPYDKRWNTHLLDEKEKDQINSLLDLKFYYLGKGCQSYVFESENGEYVLKFFKYQRFRPKPWLSYLTFLPGMKNYLEKKTQIKREKLESVFLSWKIAYEYLQKETGVFFIHLNKTQNLKKTLILYDKMGLKHELYLDNYEFMIQRKAKMLCPTIDQLMHQNKAAEVKELIHNLVSMILSEYQRGFADNDHALMQNTGVLNDHPIHIDVGQFVKNNRVKNPNLYHQEIFNKTWKFRRWLEKHHSELAEYLAGLLIEIMGEEKFSLLKPQLNKADVGIISHDEVY